MVNNVKNAYDELLDKTVERVKNELAEANTVYGGFRSAHEGYAVIKEEYDELWDEVRKTNPVFHNKEAMKHEAIQLAAMAIKFIMCMKGW